MSAPDLSPESPISLAEAAAILLLGLVKAATMETFDQVYAHHHPDHLRARKSTGSRTELRRAGG